jgi:hypothetical protein
MIKTIQKNHVFSKAAQPTLVLAAIVNPLVCVEHFSFPLAALLAFENQNQIHLVA